MTLTKKIILGVLCGLIAAGLLGLWYVDMMLSRISRSPVDSVYEDELSATVNVELPEVKPTPSPTPEPIIEDDEISLQQEMAQTALSQEEQAALEEKQKREKVTNVLLLGVDRRGTQGGSRSDTTMIATVDGANKRLKLTSLMRDMYLPIPGNGENRFNSACVKGGPELVMQTINENFAMDLEKYIQVDFRSFEKIVDRIGGITINMSSGEVAEANDCIAGLNKQRGSELRSGFITKRGGDVRLTGKQALGYARMRHFGNGDYSRTSRQFKVMQEIMREFLKLNPIEQQAVLYDVLPLVETNLTNSEILSLMVQVLGIGNFDIMHFRLPAEGLYRAKTIRGMSVLLPDIPANAKLLHEFIYEKTEQEALEYSDTQKGSYYSKVKPEEEVPDETDEIILPEGGEEVLPDDGIPDETVPDETIPDEVIPDETVPDEDGEDVIILE